MNTRLALIQHKLITACQVCIPSSLLQRACQLVAVLGIVAVFAGCSPRYDDLPAYWPIPTKEYDNYGPGRFKTALLASQIDRHYRGSVPGPIGVTTFVNIDDLYASSTFGRMVGEQLMSELTMKGFDVVELRHSDALQFLDAGGEFALSRETRALRPHRNLAAVVVGTYVVSPERVYVNARLIEPSTSLVLSAGSVEMSKTRELAKLLRGGSIPSSLERIPVKHLGYAGDSNPFDAMRRQWMMEEGAGFSGPNLPSSNGGANGAAALPLPLVPEPLREPSSSDPKTTTPKVLDQESSRNVEEPKLAIGLGR